MELSTAIKDLIKSEHLLIDNAGSCIFITYNKDKYLMTKFNNCLAKNEQEFLIDYLFGNVSADDVGVYEGVLTEEIAEKAILNFLNTYISNELEIMEILN